MSVQRNLMGRIVYMASVVEISKIFTKQNLKKIISDDTRINSLTMSSTKDLYDTFERLYKQLLRHYRNEYVYKNTLFNKLVLGTHSLNTTSAIVELPIVDSIADFILFNGKAVVYEIKTELDSLDRLEGQLANYYKAFDIVNVVISERHYESVMQRLADTPVGVIVLTQKMTLSVKKEALRFNRDLDKSVWFSILRKYEFESIVKNYYGYLPETTDFEYYSACKELFIDIDISTLYKAFITCLKNRNLHKYDDSQMKLLPNSLRSLVYFSKFSKSEYRQLAHFFK